MKKLILSFMGLLLSSGLFAQQEKGTLTITPKIGYNASNIKGDFPLVLYDGLYRDSYDSYGENGEIPFYSYIEFRDYLGSYHDDAFKAMRNVAKARYGFTAGVEAQYQVTNTCGIIFGVDYSVEDVRYDDAEINEPMHQVKFSDMKTNIHVISVPVLVHLYLYKGLAFQTGLQPEYIAKYSNSYSVERTSPAPDHKVPVTIMAEPDVRKMNLTIPLGLSYEYKNVILGARYRYCFLNMNHDSKVNSGFQDGNYHLQSISVTLGYKFKL